MYQKIAEYVNDVFKELPDNSVVGFTKKGFVASMTKKYEENLRKGFSEEDAFNNAIAQFPEITNVANDMKTYMGKRKSFYTETFKSDDFHYSRSNENVYKNNDTANHCNDFACDKKTKRAVNNFASVFWPLVLCAYFLLSFAVKGAWAYSWTIFIVAAAVQCVVKLCVFKTRAARLGAISGILWLVITSIYVTVSFATHLWQYTWIIFVFASAIQCFISAFFSKTLAGKQSAVGGIIWTLTVAIYLVVSFLTSAWNLTWIMFIFAVAVSSVARIIVEKIYLNK